MWDRAYLNRLRRELPGWVEQGWVTADSEAAIVADAEARLARGLNVIPVALAVIGALTLGAGVILFFAANWSEMSKIAKLVVLFGAMWGAYGIAGRGLSGAARASRVIAHAMLLLGVILFGANIHLIAQIYHIDAHYPNGILLWSLGALALVWLVPSQPVAVAGLALATLWSGMEIVEFDRTVHWPFLIVWGLFLPPTLHRTWKWATGVAIVALGIWCTMVFGNWSWEARGEHIFLLQIFILLAAMVHLAGWEMERQPRLADLSATVRRTALLGALFAAHFLIYVGIHGLPYWGYQDFNTATWMRGAGATGAMIALIAAFAVATFALTAIRYRRVIAARSRRDMAGFALAAATIVLMLANPFLPGRYGDVAVMYVAFNGAVFATLIWLVVDGYRSGERFQVYAAFVAYGIGLIAVYFNDFWSLMSRSLFVMAGGAVLVAGVYILERQRRRAATTAEGAP